MKTILFSVFVVLCMIIVSFSTSEAGILSPVNLGEGDGCSALSDPDIDCSDLDISVLGPQDFCGTMGRKGIVVRSNGSNDTDSDNESDGIEECICDAIDDNPNININPGDGSICDSSIDAERDQFNGTLSLGSRIQGQKYEFCYTFTSFSSSICSQQNEWKLNI